MNPTARAFHSGSDLTNPIETPYLRSRLTASGWTPSVTSIQLYSEHQKGLGTFETKPNRLINLTEPIIVAKLPNPIKIPSDMQITFRVRLDF